MYDRGQRKSDEGRGSAPAENRDRRMFADEHVQIAAHQDHETDDADTVRQTQTGRNIHNYPTRRPRIAAQNGMMAAANGP